MMGIAGNGPAPFAGIMREQSWKHGEPERGQEQPAEV